MTRWLEASRGKATASDKTDKADKTESPPLTPGKDANSEPVTSVLSVLSGGASGTRTMTQAAIIWAIKAGNRTLGSIATAAKLGVTETYQELDQMALAGLLSMDRSGALNLTAPADLGGNAWS